MKKPSIPAVQLGSPQFDQINAIKQNIEMLTGRVGGKMSTLGSTATLNDVINKLNEIIEKLQS